MNDFLMAFAIAAGGAYAMQVADTRQALSSQQQSCASQGGTWTSPAGPCSKSGQPINTAYNQWGAVPDLGLPLAAALLFTRSGTGALGALAGTAVIFLIGISQIH